MTKQHFNTSTEGAAPKDAAPSVSADKASEKSLSRLTTSIEIAQSLS
jgi:hypothetical protein